MSFKQLICISVVLCAILSVASGIVCPPDFCDTYKCLETEKCTEKQISKPGGPCDCCHICYTILAENEPCRSLTFIGVPPPPMQCDTGLICKEGKCQKITPKN